MSNRRMSQVSEIGETVDFGHMHSHAISRFKSIDFCIDATDMSISLYLRFYSLVLVLYVIREKSIINKLNASKGKPQVHK